MYISNWKTTELYKEIESRNSNLADEIRTFLKRPEVVDKMVKILDKGGTTPINFTLHDSEHSFRVAQRMWSIISDETKAALSEYDLAFLLLSAYLHDIGMSPKMDIVRNHRLYLSTHQKNLLQESDIESLQKWIDDNDKIESFNIRTEVITDPDKLDEILLYYVRYRHNDWSELWIRENLADLRFANYESWFDDLIAVCKSHHYGLEVLKGQAYNPKPFEEDKYIHLRYIAMCLRVADVMENDPERTPDVILNHRNIDGESLTYWLKDRRFKLIRSKNSFTVFARPEKAYIHKAIEETANNIESELRLCDDLTKLCPLSVSQYGNLKYSWDLEPKVTQDIIPKENSYVYIQGSFRPNTQKILELLAGSQLYGDSIWAFRELLQNSFDAVKEKVAYDILATTGSPEDLATKYGDLLTIEIKLEKRGNKYWLVLKDPGVGMTQSIIERFFLVSGSSKRHEISELERDCKQRGFNLGRTGQFGIGVLSYFMIADKIVVTTKRQPNTSYAEGELLPWRFEIDGKYDFGELTKASSEIKGCKVELKLSDTIQSEIDKWDGRFQNLLLTKMNKSPCNITYNSVVTEATLHFKRGWQDSPQLIKAKVVSALSSSAYGSHNLENDILTKQQADTLILSNQLAMEAVDETKSITDFLYDEGKIAHFGSYRIYIPYFKLKRGNCFFYLKESFADNRHFIHKIKDGHGWFPLYNSIQFSLKGLGITAEKKNSSGQSNYQIPLPNCYILVDFESIDEKNLAVSRHSIKIDEGEIQLEKLLLEKVLALLEKNKEKFSNCYDTLNSNFLDLDNYKNYWAHFETVGSEGGNKYEWKKVKLPAAEFTSSLETDKHLEIANEPLSLLPRINRYGDRYGNYYDYFQNIRAGYMYGYYESEEILPDVHMPVLWNSKFQPLGLDVLGFKEIRLPDEWNDVLYVVFTSYSREIKESQVYLNRAHKLYRYFDEAIYFSIKSSMLELTTLDLITKQDCIAFLLCAMLKYGLENWTAFLTKKSDLTDKAFEILKTPEIKFQQSRKFCTVSPNESKSKFMYLGNVVTKFKSDKIIIHRC